MKKRTERAADERIVITATPQMHRAVKVAAASRGMAVTEWLRGLIERALKKAA